MPHSSSSRPFRTAVLASAIAAGLLLPAAATAAWTTPVELDSGVGVAGVTVDGSGARLVNARVTAKGDAIDTRLLGVSADAKPDGRRTIKGVLVDPIAIGKDQLAFGRARSLGNVTRTVPNGKGGTKRITLPRYSLGVSVGSASEAALGTQRSNATAVLDEPVRIAGTSTGNLVMAWSDVGDDGVVRVYAAWRKATTKKGATVRLGEPKLMSGSRSSRLLALATGKGGSTVLVFQTGASEKTRRLFVRPLDVRTGKLGPVQTLRRGGPGFPSATAAVGARGRAVIAWGEQDGASERTKPYVVRATTRDKTGRFAVPKAIDTGGTTVRAPGGSLVSSVDGDNRATVAWSQTVGSVADGTAHDIPRVAEAGTSGGLAPARDIAAAGRVHGLAPAVAGGVTGLVLVREQERPIGGSNGDRGVAVQVAVRPAGGSLGSPETLDQLSDGQLLDRSNAFGSAAIAGLPGGGFTVAWTRATVGKGKLRSATLFSDGSPAS